METLLYWIVGVISQIHGAIMTINDSVENSFTDKELHFIVIGVLGIIMIIVIHPIFTWLARNGHTVVISFLYVFTVIVVLTFAIEIGQKITGTGSMEFADIAAGIMGFLVAFVIFAVIRGIVILIKRKLGKGRER